MTEPRHVRRAPRARYRLVSGGEQLLWQRRIDGDSRVEQIACSAAWFYAQMLKGNDNSDINDSNDAETGEGSDAGS